MEEFDKFQSCYGCPDRTAVCHSNCKGYAFRCEVAEKKRQKKAKEAQLTADLKQVKRRTCTLNEKYNRR